MEGADEGLIKLHNLSKNPPVTTLIPANSSCLDDLEECDNSEPSFKEVVFDQIIALPEANQFVVSLSTDAEMICVWDVRQ